MSSKKDIAPLKHSSVLDSVAKFHRVMENEGAQWTDFEQVIKSRARRRNLLAYLKLGCPKVNEAAQIVATPTGYKQARLILGNDFITPEEVVKARGLTYNDEQLTAFEDTLPAEDILTWCRDNGFMLIAGPPRSMSLLDIRQLKPEYFYSKEGGWYAKDKERFSREQKVNTVWIAIRKEAVPGSTSKNWQEQQALLSDMEYVPNDAEVEWAVTTYKAVRGTYLLPNIYVRTTSLDSGGSRVVVGDFVSNGLGVNDYWDGYRVGCLGVASARKF